MSTDRTSALVPPPRHWWGPLGRDERLWVVVAMIWAIAMFLMMMVIWPRIGQQQLTFDSYRVDPETYVALTDTFIQAHQVGEEFGVPVIAPPPGDVYILGQRFQFRPIVRLQRGETYRFLISSRDVQHGLSLQPSNINFQVLPGYITAVNLTPKESGEYHIICNEFCGLGHHTMVGRLYVDEEAAADRGGDLRDEAAAADPSGSHPAGQAAVLSRAGTGGQP